MTGLFTHIDHIGIAVPDLDAATRTFVRLLGTGATDPIRAPMFAMDFRMCRLGDVDFELMMPYAASSVVSRFIAARGEGLHHIAFQVPDIPSALPDVTGVSSHGPREKK